MNRRTYTPGARSTAPKWAFQNGESHTEEEDAILSRIDEERAESRIVVLMERCVLCKQTKSVTLVRNKLVCKPCRQGILEPLLYGSAGPAANAVAKRGGPFYVKLPGEDKPRLVHAPTERLARRDVAEEMGRRLPNGTKVWLA
jgi:hypothetical protein